VKLAVVAQRYGESINGGAELHARYLAEHLARHAQVEVLTTCAVDYVTWKNELPAGVEQVNGLATRRFRVRHQRSPQRFGRWSHRVFERPHSLADELTWLDAEGPASPSLVKYIARHRDAYDFFIFLSYRYYHAYHGARAAGDKAVLVPTAERDPAVGLALFRPLFAGVRALMYNSPEERAMIQAVSQNHEVPSVVVGIGSEIPRETQPERFRQKFDVRGRFAVYVGRIDENKGCGELFKFFQAYLDSQAGDLSLILIGQSLLTIPNHPRSRALGFLDDRDKFDAVSAASVLIMPSYFESLSMVALEAWGLGRPVLANAKCDVLKGQCIRSNAGLYYETRDEFVDSLRALERHRWLSGSLGRNGRAFFRENYEWPIIERKYLQMLGRLAESRSTSTTPRLPGWVERRRRVCPPGVAVLETAPRGPVFASERAEPRQPTSPAAYPPHRPSADRPRSQNQNLPSRHRPRPQGPPRRHAR
jgi:glycosyltransferase involved in cell wall biosynthesis